MKTSCYLLTLIFIISTISCGSSESNKNVEIVNLTSSALQANQITVTSKEIIPEVLIDKENSTLNELGKYLFNCVKNNDYASFSKYIPNTSILKSVLKNSSDQEKANTSEKELTQSFKRILAEAKASFDFTLEQGKTVGILWNQSIFKKTTYKISNEDGIEVGELNIFFNYKGIEYRLKLREVFKAYSGWYTVGPIYFVSDESDYETSLIDSTAG